MKRFLTNLVFLISLAIINLSINGCNKRTIKKENLYEYIAPQYNLIGLYRSSDILTFFQSDSNYSSRISFNTFISDGRDYLSCFDEGTKYVSIFDIKNQLLIKRFCLNQVFGKSSIYKPSIYIKKFDSIFIINRNQLILIDSNYIIKKTVDFIKNYPQAWLYFENGNPLSYKNNKLFIAIRPNAEATSLESLKNWRVLYSLDFENNQSMLHYSLPEMFQKSIYGAQLFHSSYCQNKKGNFVFSFYGDTTIYETDLCEYNKSYYAKSKFQSQPISPLTKKDCIYNGDELYQTRDSYGAIFFDQKVNRYLRIARQPFTSQSYIQGYKYKPESLIIFDEAFRLIGESKLGKDIQLRSILFTKDGNLFARVFNKNRKTLQFVRLEYRSMNE